MTHKAKRFYALGFVGVFSALCHPSALSAAPSCDQNVQVAPDAVQVGNGLVSPDPFVLSVTAGQGIWVKIRNTTVHVTQANVDISDSSNTVLCSTSIGVLPQRSIILHHAVFGDSISFKVVVKTGDQDVSGLTVNIYALPIRCKNGAYHEANPVLKWNVTFSGNTLSGRRADGACTLTMTRQGKNWNGSTSCTNGYHANVAAQSDAACSAFTFTAPYSNTLTRE